MVIILEVLIFLVLLIYYFLAPSEISASYLFVVLTLVLCSYILFWVHKESRSLYKNHFISNANIFIIMFGIVCFQFPLDYCLGNDSIKFSNYFYSFKTINLSTTYDALCFVAFIIGTLSTQVKNITLSLTENLSSKHYIPVRLIKCIMYFFWAFFVAFINYDYVNGGHGSVPLNSISAAAYGYYFRLSSIYLALMIYNQRGQKTISLKAFFTSLPIFYWVTVIISVCIFLFAHNRVYVIYLCVPIFFYAIIITEIKTKPLLSLVLLLGVGAFFTFFKLLGITGVFGGDNLNMSNFDGYDRLTSFSPFTSELAGSVLSDSALFYMWHTSGVVIPGSTLVYGLLRTISGLVPLFYTITGLNDSYSSCVMITLALGADSGLGTSASGDLIVSVGFVIAILIMFFFGKLCKYGDASLFLGGNNMKGVLIGMCLSCQIAFVPRASLCDVIAMILFSLLFMYIYKGIKYL